MERRKTMSENTNSKFKTTKKIVKTANSSDPAQQFYGVNLITSSKINTENSKRLLTPIEAERRRSLIMYGSHDGDSSIRRMRRPTKKLSLRPAPVVPTAPKSAAEIKKNYIKTRLKDHFELIDKQFVLIVAILSFLGIFTVYSATLTYSSKRYIIIQIAAAVAGLAIIAFMSFLDYRQFANKYRIVILINATLLLFTFFFGEGVTNETNANWINLGFIKIQPSEFAKILFIYSFAAHLYFVRDRINKLFTAMTLFLHAILIIGLTLLQKDLGTVTIFFFIFIVMCFAANLNIWYFIAGLAATVVASPFIWEKLNPFQQQRILVLFDSSIDPEGVGIRYQTLRGMTAIRLGGLTGSGFTKGEITQSNFVAKHTDMIFSTICEEFGFIGGAAVLLLYIFLIIKIIQIAIRCENPLGCFICTGVAAMFVIQIVENVGMCLGVMPVIGITLPFISYGGSSALSSYIAIGMVLSVCTHKDKAFFG